MTLLNLKKSLPNFSLLRWSVLLTHLLLLVGCTPGPDDDDSPNPAPKSPTQKKVTVRDSDPPMHMYVEAVVTLTAEGVGNARAKSACADWFEAQGYSVLPMRNGLLVRGTESQTAKQLRVLQIGDLPGPLNEWVSDISVRPPPDYQE
ncbi:MAG: hypothetical protein AAF358_08845 [Pseudomonadota bacterium]